MQITDIKFEAYRWPRTKPITNGLYTYTHAGLNAIIVETDENVQGLGLTTDLVSANIISAIVEGLKPALIAHFMCSSAILEEPIIINLFFIIYFLSVYLIKNFKK